MSQFSRPSPAIFSINIPEIDEGSAKFEYNYYVPDEGVNEFSGIPNALLKVSSEQALSLAPNFSNRLCRYVVLNWKLRTIEKRETGVQFAAYLNRIVSEESFITSRYVPYTFSMSDVFENAYRDINDDGVLDFGTSQATAIDQFVSSMLQDYVDTDDTPERKKKREELAKAIRSIETIADRPEKTLGFNFLDDKGNETVNTSGFAELVKKSEIFLTSQINATVVPDMFFSSSLPPATVNELNRSYTQTINRTSFDVNDAIVKPIAYGDFTDPVMIMPTNKTIVGYLIEKYELTQNGLVKNKTIAIQNPDATTVTDAFVKYGATYYYAIRTVAKVETVGFDDDPDVQTTRMLTYLVCSKPKMISVNCTENIPPPPPTDINFIWDYKKNKLKIVWSLPLNPQRDIRQFQVFRRLNINDPFELIGQKSFDYSSKKFLSGERIDANSNAMTNEEESFVMRDKLPIMYHVDNDFETDIDLLKTSKFIYTVASVDAHGLVSNYGAQFEISFDFFKNRIAKKFISSEGAPRQYPNMKVDIDLFKDTIKTEGQSSLRMKVYFMPEYFKIRYPSKSNDSVTRVQNMVSTSAQNSYYKIQFINTQNQKSDSLKIIIDDPDEMAK
jgi:hypothetical protein